jgi:hypothetical protein
MLLSGLPEAFAGFSDLCGQRLAAYSCGGSSGFGFFGRTGFPLSSGKNVFPENHDGSTYRQHRARVNSRVGHVRVAPLFTGLSREVKNFASHSSGPLTPRRE